MTERVEGATFADETVRLDGRTFVSCTFGGCRIAYAGGSTQLVGCTFTDCAWHLEEGAANTVELLEALGARMPERLGVAVSDEVRIDDVTIRTSPDEAGEGAATVSGETPEGAARQRAGAGRWIFVSADLAWIVIAAGAVLVTVALGRTGG